MEFQSQNGPPRHVNSHLCSSDGIADHDSNERLSPDQRGESNQKFRYGTFQKLLLHHRTKCKMDNGRVLVVRYLGDTLALRGWSTQPGWRWTGKSSGRPAKNRGQKFNKLTLKATGIHLKASTCRMCLFYSICSSKKI